MLFLALALQRQHFAGHRDVDVLRRDARQRRLDDDLVARIQHVDREQIPGVRQRPDAPRARVLKHVLDGVPQGCHLGERVPTGDVCHISILLGVV